MESDQEESINLMIAADFSYNNELISLPYKASRNPSENTIETNDLESISEEISLQRSQVFNYLFINFLSFFYLFGLFYFI